MEVEFLLRACSCTAVKREREGKTETLREKRRKTEVKKGKGNKEKKE